MKLNFAQFKNTQVKKIQETNPHSEEETIHQIFDNYFPDDSSVPEEETEEVNLNLSNDNDYPDILSRMQALLNFNCNDGSRADFNMNHFIDSSIPEALHNDLEEEAGIKNVCDPFRNMLEFVLIAFFDGCSINISEEKIKLLYFVIKVVMALKEAESSLKLPAVDYLLNYHSRKKNRIPKFPTSEHQVKNNNTGEVHTLFMNKPSKYIEFLMADPVNSPALLQSMPDFSPDELTCLQQGEKWRTNEMFQSPIHSNGTLDIWVGDLVNTNYAGTNNCFLVSRFYHKTISGSSAVFFTGFPVYFTDNVISDPQLRSKFVISCQQAEVLVASVTCILRKDDDYTFSLDSGFVLYDNNASTPFRPCSRGSLIDQLWRNKYQHVERLKRRKPDGSLMKVVMAPITLFTDDTSGNLSKQYSVFDSYLMTLAALSFNRRGSKNDTYFICTANKNLSAIDMLPPLVDDLLVLENGYEVYSIVHHDLSCQCMVEVALDFTAESASMGN
ncbi:hypothetical protein BD408DRAFT_438391 [Parasitella parasitica]|nr:hypothetical protein BD408DRAFT_438391 [Parasitella parasitica]